MTICWGWGWHARIDRECRPVAVFDALARIGSADDKPAVVTRPHGLLLVRHCHADRLGTSRHLTSPHILPVNNMEERIQFAHQARGELACTHRELHLAMFCRPWGAVLAPQQQSTSQCITGEEANTGQVIHTHQSPGGIHTVRVVSFAVASQIGATSVSFRKRYWLLSSAPVVRVTMRW